MKIGVAQFDCEIGNPRANCRTIQKLVAQAGDAGCRLIVLPEMADTGYDMGAIMEHASCWNDGPCRELRRFAAESRIAVICGLSERDGDRCYNAAAIIDESGALIGKYRKTHLFSLDPVCEDRHLGRGDSLIVTEIAGYKIGVMICYDLRFPEMARVLALRGAEILVVPAAWPASRIAHWNLLTVARAVENQAYLAAANRVGTDGTMIFGGDSGLIDPLGAYITRAGESQPSLLIGEIDRACVLHARQTMHIFDDRRPDLYNDIGST